MILLKRVREVLHQERCPLCMRAIRKDQRTTPYRGKTAHWRCVYYEPRKPGKL